MKPIHWQLTNLVLCAYYGTDVDAVADIFEFTPYFEYFGLPRSHLRKNHIGILMRGEDYVCR
jgi:hypothetical protein